MKKFIALLMAGVMLLSFAACGGNEEETPTTTVPETTINSAEQEELENLLGGEDETEVATEIVTEIVTNEEGETEIVTEIVTEKPTKTNTEEPTNKKDDVDVSKWSTAEVLKYYKAVTNNVETKKPGYTKERSAVDKGYEAGAVLQAFKGEVFKFLGIGAENKFTAVVPKGQTTTDDRCGSFLKTSGLTEADVKSANAVKSGSNYIITIEVKEGTSSIEGGKNSKNNSPIDKSGICAPGNADRSGFDHKSAQVTYAALQDFASGLVMKEQTKNGKIVATVNAANGELTSLVISWDASAELTKVMGSSATLSAATTVKYSKFGW